MVACFLFRGGLALVQVPAATTAAAVREHEEGTGGACFSQNNPNQSRGVIMENIRALLTVPDDYIPSPGLPCRLALLCSLALCLRTCTLMCVRFPPFLR